jgi:outer membrane protein assembly factor BamB
MSNGLRERLRRLVMVTWMWFLCGVVPLAGGRSVQGQDAAERPWRRLASTVLQGSVREGAWDVDDEGIAYCVVTGREEDREAEAIVALDTRNGKELWRITAGLDAPTTSLLRVPGGPVVAYLPGQAIIGLDPRTGAKLWRQDAAEPRWVAEWNASEPPADLWPQPPPPPGALAIAGDRLLVLSPSGLTRIDPADGRREWSLPLHLRSYFAYSAPVIAGETAFCVVPSGEGGEFRRRLVAVDVATGRELWSADVGPIPIIGDPPMTPIPVGACAASGQSVICIRHRVDSALGVEEDTPRPFLVCLDPRSGALRWRAPLPKWPYEEANPTGLVSSGDYGGVLLCSGPFLVYDLVGGRVLYECMYLSPTPPVISGQFLAHLSHEDALTISDLEWGEEVATVDLGMLYSGEAKEYVLGEVRAIGERFAVVQRNDRGDNTRVVLVGQ